MLKMQTDINCHAFVQVMFVPHLPLTVCRELKEHSDVLKLQMREIKRREKEVKLLTCLLHYTHLLFYQAALLEQKQAKLIQDQIKLQKAVRFKQLVRLCVCSHACTSLH